MILKTLDRPSETLNLTPHITSGDKMILKTLDRPSGTLILAPYVKTLDRPSGTLILAPHISPRRPDDLKDSRPTIRNSYSRPTYQPPATR
ncbi:hypothetical protein RRG08_064126 [Elysia crispata]|uniref:Uncharacterized protein n=1 Tax=Elysia crispata TaxID=231223 RepID=A0AAE1DIL1_9GAST|nr:hypothetical protein RRG08_064126 [Elysia crispata]